MEYFLHFELPIHLKFNWLLIKFVIFVVCVFRHSSGHRTRIFRPDQSDFEVRIYFPVQPIPELMFHFCKIETGYSLFPRISCYPLQTFVTKSFSIYRYGVWFGPSVGPEFFVVFKLIPLTYSFYVIQLLIWSFGEITSGRQSLPSPFCLSWDEQTFLRR